MSTFRAFALLLALTLAAVPAPAAPRNQDPRQQNPMARQRDLPLDLQSYDGLLFQPGVAPMSQKEIEARLTPQEREALRISQQWQSGANSRGQKLRPVQGPDGSVRFIYGQYQPSIVCAVMQVTDIELEPGEVINSLHIGDTARWLFEPAVTGSDQGEIQHIIIKPTDIGLETNMIATTNRRTYHIRLKSDRDRYMPKVSFIYPGQVMERWQAATSRRREEVRNKTIPETGAYMDNLDFNYKIDGDALWKPVRVYTDGVKTIIQLPPGRVREAPTLLLMRGNETVMANYRLQDGRYVVDDVFDKAILITGVGRNQTRVTITRK